MAQHCQPSVAGLQMMANKTDRGLDDRLLLVLLIVMPVAAALCRELVALLHS